MKKLLFTLALALLLSSATAAQAASITLNFNVDHFGGAGGSPYGSVTLNDFGGTGDVLVTVLLFNGSEFVHTGFEGTFAWNLLGNPTISVTGLPAGWTLTATTAGSLHMDGFGNLEYSVNTPGQGGGASEPGPLSFHVLATGITIGSFVQLSSGGSPSAYFVADIIGATGLTGAIGVTGTPDINPLCPTIPCQELPGVPEPATLVLLGTGLALAAMRLRRKSA